MAQPTGEGQDDIVHKIGTYVDTSWCTESQRACLDEEIRKLVDRVRSGGDPVPGPVTLDEAYPQLRAMLLDRRHAAHVQVIEAAARNGGFIERERVYRIIARDQGRRLNGFCRPVMRVCDELRQAGVLAKDAPPLLTAAMSTPGRAAGFLVPHEIVALFRTELAA